MGRGDEWLVLKCFGSIQCYFQPPCTFDTRWAHLCKLSTHVRVHVCACMHVCMRVCVHACVYARVCARMCVCVCVHVHAHAYAHARTHTHAHTHMHVRTYVRIFLDIDSRWRLVVKSCKNRQSPKTCLCQTPSAGRTGPLTPSPGFPGGVEFLQHWATLGCLLLFVFGQLREDSWPAAVKGLERTREKQRYCRGS